MSEINPTLDCLDSLFLVYFDFKPNLPYCLHILCDRAHVCIHRSVAMDLDEHYLSSENGRDSDDTKTKTCTVPRRVVSS